jgi:hypothetical protein
MRRWRKIEKVLLLLIGVVLVQQVYTLWKAYTKHHGAATYTDASGRRHEYALFYYEETWRLHDAGLDWLASQGKPGEIVAATTPQWVYLKTGLQAVMPPYEADPRTAQRLVDEIPIEYLVVDQLSFLDVGRRYTRPMLETFPDRWKLVYATVDSGPRIYRRVPAGGKKVSPSLGTK